MAKDRMIRAQITRSESLSRCSLQAYHFFQALPMHCDDHGRFKYVPRLVRVDLYPLRDDVSDREVQKWLDELEAAGFIERWEIDGNVYAQVPLFSEHQKLRHRSKSSIPRAGDEEEQPVRSTAPSRLPSEVLEALEQAFPGRVGDRQYRACLQWMYGKSKFTGAEVVEALGLAIGTHDPVSYAGKILRIKRDQKAIETTKPAKPMPELLPTWEESAPFAEPYVEPVE